MNCVLFNKSTNKYFRDGDFTESNKKDATPLDKETAKDIQNKLNGITLKKPIEIQEI